MKISSRMAPTLAAFLFPLNACALVPLCGNLTSTQRSIANAKVLNVHIMGTDDRQAEEAFGDPQNLEAQKILGLQEISHSISAIVPVECFYTGKDNKSYVYKFNGSLVCDHTTLLINAHSLEKALCKDIKNNFVCRIPKTSQFPEVFLNKPNPQQIKAKDLCTNISPDDDVAILNLYEPTKRTPIKIGVVNSFKPLEKRQFVNVAANVSSNYNGSSDTEKTFSIGTYDEADSTSTAKTSIDGGPGSSGSPHLINQQGELLAIGINEGGRGQMAGGILKDGHSYSLKNNYSIELFFNKDIKNFLKKNIKNPNKCLKEVRPAGEVST